MNAKSATPRNWDRERLALAVARSWTLRDREAVEALAGGPVEPRLAEIIGALVGLTTRWVTSLDEYKALREKYPDVAERKVVAQFLAGMTASLVEKGAGS